MVRPQPCSHATGFLGLYSQSLRWAARLSNFVTAVHPCDALSHFIDSRESRFLRILGTGCKIYLIESQMDDHNKRTETPHKCVIVQRRGVTYHHTDKSQLLEWFSYLFNHEKGTIIPTSLFPKDKWTIPLYTEWKLFSLELNVSKLWIRSTLYIQ